MRRWKTWLGLTLLFTAGLVIGVALTLGVIRWRVETIAAGGPQAFVQFITDQAARRASLDDEERRKVLEIAQSMQQEIMSVRSQGAGRLQAAMEEVKHSLEEELPPEKAAKLIRWLEENDARWQKWRIESE